MNLEQLIKKKVKEIEDDTAPTYCGEGEYKNWELQKDAKIQILEELSCEMNELHVKASLENTNSLENHIQNFEKLFKETDPHESKFIGVNYVMLQNIIVGMRLMQTYADSMEKIYRLSEDHFKSMEEGEI